MTRMMVMFRQWICVRRFLFVHKFLLFCSMTTMMLFSIFTEIKLYQVQLTKGKKVEINFSKLNVRTSENVPSCHSSFGTTKKLKHMHWSLEEEERCNKLHLLHKNSTVHNVTRENMSHTELPCAGQPASHEFVFHNITDTVHIYSAFWDSRWNDFDNKNNGTYVRMFGFAQQKDAVRKKIKHKLSCLFFIQGTYHSVPADVYLLCEHHGKPLASYMFSCQVPAAVKSIVCSVLVAQGEVSDPKLATRIPVQDTASHEERFSIAQCVPPLFGAISDHRFIEFVEMSKILGSQHMTIYMTDGAKFSQAIEYYKQTGFLTVMP